MKLFVVTIVLAFLSSAYGKVFTKCELARVLLNNGFRSRKFLTGSASQSMRVHLTRRRLTARMMTVPSTMESFRSTVDTGARKIQPPEKSVMLLAKNFWMMIFATLWHA
uniref:Uncharacterized protein n=1 Tax=Anopheles atroparvus TaxID=41427 RepID=A0AAG5DH39_ANOAO